uniref:Putative ovule protein n=1 Tax=Solanum chacoense TaxID=4108 RepID=A0A0V0GVR6_SOLCH
MWHFSLPAKQSKFDHKFGHEILFIYLKTSISHYDYQFKIFKRYVKKLRSNINLFESKLIMKSSLKPSTPNPNPK